MTNKNIKKSQNSRFGILYLVLKLKLYNSNFANRQLFNVH
jgi:hypothetical protein